MGKVRDDVRLRRCRWRCRKRIAEEEPRPPLPTEPSSMAQEIREGQGSRPDYDGSHHYEAVREHGRFQAEIRTIVQEVYAANGVYFCSVASLTIRAAFWLSSRTDSFDHAMYWWTARTPDVVL